MLLNTARAFLDPVGFAVYMGLPLTDTANHGFVQVYALRAAFLGLCAFGLLWLRDIRALGVFVLAALVMPIGDALLTASNHAPPLIVARHGATAVVLAVTAWLLFNRARKEANA
jgi:hypothetical protein